MAEESESGPPAAASDRSDAPGSRPPPNSGREAQPRWRRLARRWGLRLAVVGLLIGAAFTIPWLRYALSHETTDDAYVEATIVPISPQVSGQVIAVHVDDNQDVSKGQPLFEIDPSDYRARVDQASATLASKQAAVTAAQARVEMEERTVSQMKAQVGVAQANLQLATIQRKRARSLLEKGAGSQNVYDEAESAWKVDGARLAEARASAAQAAAALQNAHAGLASARLAVKDAESALVLAQIDLERTRVTAPRAGRVAMKHVDRGRYVAAGEDVMALVDLSDVWVRASYKETQVGRMSVGQPVDIDVDAYPGKHFHGHVESLQAGSGAVFSLLPPENSTGNFVKVVQRIPVRIALDGPPDREHPLLPGMSVEPHVDVSVTGDSPR